MLLQIAHQVVRNGLFRCASEIIRRATGSTAREPWRRVWGMKRSGRSATGTGAGLPLLSAAGPVLPDRGVGVD